MKKHVLLLLLALFASVSLLSAQVVSIDCAKLKQFRLPHKALANVEAVAANQNGTNFNIVANSVSYGKANVAFTPNDASMYWYYNVVAIEQYDSVTPASFTAYVKSMIDQYYGSYIKNGIITYADILLQGAKSDSLKNLEPNTEYVVMAWGIDPSSFTASTPFDTIHIHTLQGQMSDNIITMAYNNGTMAVSTMNNDPYFFIIETLEAYQSNASNFSQASLKDEARSWINQIGTYLSFFIYEGSQNIDAQQFYTSLIAQSMPEGDYIALACGHNGEYITTDVVYELFYYGGAPVNGITKVKFGDLFYYLDATYQTAEITSQNSSSPYWSTAITTANIPASVTYNDITYNVTSIGNSAFNNCSSLTSLTIPESVTSIGDYAFSGCSSITSLTIPNSVTSIGYRAFSNCSSLTSVTIGNSVTSISDEAFHNCSSLTSIEIPNSITNIGYLAFADCTSLTSVTIGNNVTNISDKAFHNCSSLTSIEIPNSITNIGYLAFADCTSLTSVTIGNNVTSIGERAFAGCSGLALVEWNATNCSEISSSTFSSSITSFSFGNEVERIPSFSCYGMNNLTSMTIPNSVTSIGASAFSGCSSLTSINIPNSVTSIEGGAFASCSSLTSIEIPNSVTSIGSNAFNGCIGLTSITIGNSVTSIEVGAFSGCSSLNSVTIPNSVTSLKGRAFTNCSGLTSVTIPNSVTSIGGFAFENCVSLTSVTIPNSIASIAACAFFGCSNLITVIWNAKNCIDFTSSSTPFYYYYNNSSTGNYNLREQIISFTFGEEVEHIPAYLCSGMSNLTSIILPNSVRSIGNNAFYGCNKIATLIIPDNVQTIGESAFSNCTMLQNLTLGTSVNSIGNSAFANCPYLIDIHAKMALPPVIDASVFSGCGDLSGITLNVPQRSLAQYRKTNVWKEFYLQGVNDNVSDFTISFRDKDSEIFESEFISIAVPDAPVIAGFTFIKWQVVAGDLENGIDIQAVYTSNTITSSPSVYINPTNPTQKLIREGNVYILRDGKTYTVHGQEVK